VATTRLYAFPTTLSVATLVSPADLPSGTYFFAMAGVGKAFENSVILVAVGVVAIIINTCVITRWGRRRVFLVSGLLLCGVVQLIIAALYTVNPTSPSTLKAIVGLTIVYIMGYNGKILGPACIDSRP
jgi:MFS transporter, SP family, sugar:H+ symporter